MEEIRSPGYWVAIKELLMARPIKAVIDISKTVTRKLFDKKIRVLTEATFDPKWEDRMAEAMKFKQPRSQYRAALQLFRDIEEDQTESESSQ